MHQSFIDGLYSSSKLAEIKQQKTKRTKDIGFELTKLLRIPYLTESMTTSRLQLILGF